MIILGKRERKRRESALGEKKEKEEKEEKEEKKANSCDLNPSRNGIRPSQERNGDDEDLKN